MPSVKVSDYNNLQAALNAFNDKVKAAHIMRDYRNQQSFSSAAEIRRTKQIRRKSQQKRRQMYRQQQKQ